MKKTLLATTAALACTLGQAQTAPAQDFDLFLSAGMGSNRIKAGGESDTHGAHELRGTAAYTHASGFGFQSDVVLNGQKLGFGPGDSLKIKTTDLALHGFYRDQTGLLGLVGQKRSFEFDSKDESADISLDALLDSRDFWAVEGQLYLGDVTLNGQLGRSELNSKINNSLNLGGNVLNLGANYFLEDNWRFDVSYLRTTMKESDCRGRSGVLALGTEYRLEQSPASVFLQWQHINGKGRDSVDSFSMQENRLLAGVRVNFDTQGTLRGRNARGASLNPVAVDNVLIQMVACGFRS